MLKGKEGGADAPRSDWSFPNAVRLGAGRIAELPEVCAAAGIERPLFVADSGLAELPMTQKALASLRAEGMFCEMFADLRGEPGEKDLAAGADVFLKNRHDGVVAFGGGSALDLGKLIALIAKQTISVWELEDRGDNWRRADAAAIFPLVAVPTTAGTGSEVGRAAVLSNSQKRMKKIIFHPGMLPAAAVCDPELTAAMPPPLTAGTGMDAFTHCWEAFCARGYHPPCRGIALEGMRLINDNLPKAFLDGGDIAARANMMSAAAMGAIAFQKGLGAAHAISHAVGAKHRTPHGMTNAAVLPAVLRFNRPAVEKDAAAAAAHLGIDGGFDGFYERVMELRKLLAVPEKLSGLGVVDADVDVLAALALSDPSAGGNPIELNLESLKQLLAECL